MLDQAPSYLALRRFWFEPLSSVRLLMVALFEATRIKSMELANRLVRSATFEGMADAVGAPTPALVKLYEQLAKGGVGLIITGNSYVCADGRSSFPGMAGIDRDELIPTYRSLVEQVHRSGGKIAMQLVHCGRQTSSEVIGGQPIAPSPVKDATHRSSPRAMTEEDIERVIEAFAEAARRVKASGFDAVQLHAAHGYLINQFLCPHTNRRTDRWGGPIENRMRFVRETYARCRREVGSDYPILVKINAYDAMRGGLRLEESVVMAEQMAKMGFDGIEVSCGIGEDGFSTFRGEVPLDVLLTEWEEFRRRSFFFKLFARLFGRWLVRPPPLSQGFNRAAARAIKERVGVPVFVVGGFTEPAAIHETIASGDADYVSLGRALVADPKFPRKMLSGSTAPSLCKQCNLCIGYIASRPLRCRQGKRAPALLPNQVPPERQLAA